jgi:hypothetical protein
LSSRAGADGKVLVHCFAGCAVQAIMSALHLPMSALFAGPPPTPEQIQEAARQQAIAEAAAAERRCARRELADRYRRLNELQDRIAARLAPIVFRSDVSEGNEREADALAAVLHSTIDKVRAIESVYAEAEAREFYERLVRICELHHIDRQHLLARYGLPVEDHTMEAA